jgi:hypothetical protein
MLSEKALRIIKAYAAALRAIINELILLSHVDLTQLNCGKTMCEKCVEIDRRIAHLKDMASSIFDQQMLDGIDSLVAELEAQKTKLHPEESKYGAASVGQYRLSAAIHPCRSRS